MPSPKINVETWASYIGPVESSIHESVALPYKNESPAKANIMLHPTYRVHPISQNSKSKYLFFHMRKSQIQCERRRLTEFSQEVSSILLHSIRKLVFPFQFTHRMSAQAPHRKYNEIHRWLQQWPSIEIKLNPSHNRMKERGWHLMFLIVVFVVALFIIEHKLFSGRNAKLE